MATVRTSAGWYGAAGALVFVGMMVAPVVLAVHFVRSLPKGEKFEAPGRCTWVAEKPGTYVVWEETSEIHKGGRVSFGDSKDGLRISVAGAEDGREVSVTPDFSTRERSMGSERRSLATLEIPRAGRYRIEVAGAFSTRPFLVRSSILGRILGLILGLVVSATAAISGVALAIVVFIRRSRPAQTATPPSAV